MDEFNGNDVPVFLISLKAGNTGLNLVGASVVVHADPWWNAAAQNQATDRAHRIGQTQDVNVYQIVAKDTIEERILKLQGKKSELAQQFTDGTASGGVGTLSKDDLLSLTLMLSPVSSIRTLTVGSGFSPDQPLSRVAGFGMGPL